MLSRLKFQGMIVVLKRVREVISRMDEEELLDALMDFATSLEAGIVQLKKNLYDLTQKANDAKPLWDPDKIVWVKAESEKGMYEKACVEGNRGNVDFENLVKDLKVHGGKLRKGSYFYWLFESAEGVVGRKPVKRKA
jgi:hypothetical protein